MTMIMRTFFLTSPKYIIIIIIIIIVIIIPGSIIISGVISVTRIATDGFIVLKAAEEPLDSLSLPFLQIEIM